MSPADGRAAGITALYGERWTVFGIGLQATDAVMLGGLVLFALLTAAFASRVSAPGALLVQIALLAALYVVAIALHARLSSRVAKFFLRTGAVQILCAQAFFIAERLQLIFSPGWRDPVVLRLEQGIFGVQPTVWLQRFVTPALTEWLMFAYVFYLVIYPGLAALIFFRGGEQGEKRLEDFLFVLAVTNTLCFLGFLAFPVAGPLYFQPEAYTVPLQGGIFTAAGEFVRHHLHVAGGNLPSPHCAIATVMWLIARRYVLPAYYALAPVILSLYVSTFFLRYHYVTDSVLGVLTGAFALAAAPALVRAWNAAVSGRREKA